MAGPVTSTEEFTAICAATGTGAQCCALPLGADALPAPVLRVTCARVSGQGIRMFSRLPFESLRWR